MRFTILLLLATTAFAGDTCSSAKRDLDSYLQTLPTSCSADSDCTGRYFGADACEPPVVTNKEKFTDNHQLFLLQKSVRVACGTQDKPRPVCSPIPFRAECRQNKCVDTLQERIAALPKGAYSHGTINHSCGPADGPALAMTLTHTKDSKEPWIYINLNGDLPELPASQKTYTIAPGEQVGAGRCTKTGDCYYSDAGSVTLEHLDGNGGSGHYKLHLMDGTTEEGDFQLRWVEVHMMCG
jgi:hypothetical protein